MLHYTGGGWWWLALQKCHNEVRFSCVVAKKMRCNGELVGVAHLVPRSFFSLLSFAGSA